MATEYFIAELTGGRVLRKNLHFKLDFAPDGDVPAFARSIFSTIKETFVADGMVAQGAEATAGTRQVILLALDAGVSALPTDPRPYIVDRFELAGDAPEDVSNDPAVARLVGFVLEKAQDQDRRPKEMPEPLRAFSGALHGGIQLWLDLPRTGIHACYEAMFSPRCARHRDDILVLRQVEETLMVHRIGDRVSGQLGGFGPGHNYHALLQSDPRHSSLKAARQVLEKGCCSVAIRCLGQQSRHRRFEMLTCPLRSVSEPRPSYLLCVLSPLSDTGQALTPSQLSTVYSTPDPLKVHFMNVGPPPFGTRREAASGRLKAFG